MSGNAGGTGGTGIDPTLVHGPNNTTVVAWVPQEGKQTAAIECPIPELCYGGARGGGKTDFMRLLFGAIAAIFFFLVLFQDVID